MPRKYPADVIGIRQFGSGFNEAGADAPEIRQCESSIYQILLRASMRPGRMPRKYSALAIGPVAWSFDRFCE